MSDQYPIVTDAEGTFRTITKRLNRQERRRTVASVEDVLGPGITAQAVQIVDWCDPSTAFNGFYHSVPGSVNSPDTNLSWTGETIAKDDGSGMQQVWNTDTELLHYTRTFNISYPGTVEQPERMFFDTVTPVTDPDTSVWAEVDEGVAQPFNDDDDTTGGYLTTYHDPGGTDEVGVLLADIVFSEIVTPILHIRAAVWAVNDEPEYDYLVEVIDEDENVLYSQTVTMPGLDTITEDNLDLSGVTDVLDGTMQVRLSRGPITATEVGGYGMDVYEMWIEEGDTPPPVEDGNLVFDDWKRWATPSGVITEDDLDPGLVDTINNPPVVPPTAPVAPTFRVTGLTRGIIVQVTNGQPGWEYTVTITDIDPDTNVSPATQSYPPSQRNPLYFEEMPDGSKLSPDSDGYTFQVTATNSAGSAASPTSDPQQLVLGDDSTIAELSVDKLTTGDLTAPFALIGRVEVGDNITIDPGDGIRIRHPNFDPDKNPNAATVLPSDGSGASLAGEATLDKLTVKGDMKIQGRTNEISTDSDIKLASGITAPGSGPTIQPFWPSGLDNRLFTWTIRGLGYHSATQRYYRSESLFGCTVSCGTRPLGTWNMTNLPADPVSIDGTDGDPGGGNWNRPEVGSGLGGVTIIGNTMYVLCETDENLPYPWRIYRGTYSSGTDKWTYVGRSLYEPTTSLGRFSDRKPAIGKYTSFGYVVVAQCGSGKGTVNISTYDPSGNFVDRIVLKDKDGNNLNIDVDIAACGIDNAAGWSGDCIWIMLPGSNKVRVFSNSTFREIEYNSFTIPGSVAPDGCIWRESGNEFLATAGLTMYGFTNLAWDTYGVTQTWRDSVNGYETDPAKKVSYYQGFPRRAAVRLSSKDAIPPGANSLRFYLATNDTDVDPVTETWRQADPAVGATSLDTFTITTGGTHPPAASNFPSGTPAQIVSTEDIVPPITPNIDLKGSGEWRLGRLSGDASGAVYGSPTVPIGGILMWPASIPPSGYLLCQGGTFSSLTYPTLATVLQDQFGAHSGNTYYLPDFMGRFPFGTAPSYYETGYTEIGNNLAGNPVSRRIERLQHVHKHTISDGTSSLASNTSTGGSAQRVVGFGGSDPSRHNHGGDTGNKGLNDENSLSNHAMLAINFIIRAI